MLKQFSLEGTPDGLICVGAYSDSAGVEVVRRHAAEYITRRDAGVKSNYQDVFLSNGASDAIKVRFTNHHTAL